MLATSHPPCTRPQQILASRHLDCEALLRVVPRGGRLLELRAALLERLGRCVGRGGAHSCVGSLFGSSALLSCAVFGWAGGLAGRPLRLPSTRSPACCPRFLSIQPASLLPPCHLLCNPTHRHTEALRIYVHRLKQLPLAEAYCDRVYRRRQLAAREARHAELAAALRRQRSQRDAAAAAAAGLPAPAAALAPATPSSSGSGGGGARALPFGGGTQAAAAPGVAATRLQPPPGSSASEDGSDIYLLMVQASGGGPS